MQTNVTFFEFAKMIQYRKHAGPRRFECRRCSPLPTCRSIPSTLLLLLLLLPPPPPPLMPLPQLENIHLSHLTCEYSANYLALFRAAAIMNYSDRCITTAVLRRAARVSSDVQLSTCRSDHKPTSSSKYQRLQGPRPLLRCRLWLATLIVHRRPSRDDLTHMPQSAGSQDHQVAAACGSYRP